MKEVAAASACTVRGGGFCCEDVVFQDCLGPFRGHDHHLHRDRKHVARATRLLHTCSNKFCVYSASNLKLYKQEANLPAASAQRSSPALHVASPSHPDQKLDTNTFARSLRWDQVMEPDAGNLTARGISAGLHSRRGRAPCRDVLTPPGTEHAVRPK